MTLRIDSSPIIEPHPSLLRAFLTATNIDQRIPYAPMPDHYLHLTLGSTHQTVEEMVTYPIVNEVQL